MRVCEVIFGSERGAQLAEFVEGATGEPCPCKAGATCPLLTPNDGVEQAAMTLGGQATRFRAMSALVMLGYGVPAAKFVAAMAA